MGSGFRGGKVGKGGKGKGKKVPPVPLEVFAEDGVVHDSTGWLVGTIFSWGGKGYTGTAMMDEVLYLQPGLCSEPSCVFSGFVDLNVTSGPPGLSPTNQPALGQRIKCRVAYGKHNDKINALEWQSEDSRPIMTTDEQQFTRGTSLSEGSEKHCMQYFQHSCVMQDAESCPAGKHTKAIRDLPTPSPAELFEKMEGQSLEDLKKQWAAAHTKPGAKLLNAWLVQNPRLDATCRVTEYNMRREYNKLPDKITGYHGTPDANIIAIATNGFSPDKRVRNAFGAGEYFAKDPQVSQSYSRGGSFMFQCELILGEEGVHHEWQAANKYYIMKQKEGNVQAMPRYLLQWVDKAPTDPLLRTSLEAAETNARPLEEVMRSNLGGGQLGGTAACKARWWCGMCEETTVKLWLGWLDPLLYEDELVEQDVKKFLAGYEVAEVLPDRNASRVGAYVLLKEPITKKQYAQLAVRKYRDQYSITVDDAQACSRLYSSRGCPKLRLKQRYCRSWNLRGHYAWHEACSWMHKAEDFKNAGARVEYEVLSGRGAKYDEISKQVLSDPDLKELGITIKCIKKITNETQDEAYGDRKDFMTNKYGNVVEKELWHGTCCSVLEGILQDGLQCPSDCKAADTCPVSGGKGLRTTLCGTDCVHCTEEHKWDKCHMFGLGIYFADIPMKSHRYVTGMGVDGVHTLLRCKVNLGNPYYIEGNLKKKDAMHNYTTGRDPSQLFDRPQDTWNPATGHASVIVKGLGVAVKPGYGVMNTEYIIYHPMQVVPLYAVEYTIGGR